MAKRQNNRLTGAAVLYTPDHCPIPAMQHTGDNTNGSEFSVALIWQSGPVIGEIVSGGTGSVRLSGKTAHPCAVATLDGLQDLIGCRARVTWL